MGRRVEIDLKNGRTIRAPRRAAMLYDETGVMWPDCSLLIMHFTPWVEDPTDAEVSKANDYFGDDYDLGVGRLKVPHRKEGWKRVGDVDTIFYSRAGNKAPGKFRHEFNKPRGSWKLIHWLKGGSKEVTLYRNTRIKAYRLELPGNCHIDDRGVAYP